MKTAAKKKSFYKPHNDMVGAAKYYKQAAEYGHPGTQNNLGNQYKNGRGVDRNPQED